MILVYHVLGWSSTRAVLWEVKASQTKAVSPRSPITWVRVILFVATAPCLKENENHLPVMEENHIHLTLFLQMFQL